MTEENQATTEATPPATETTAAAQGAVKPADTDLDALLAGADRERLRRNPVIAGIVGDLFERRWRERQEADATEKAERDAEADRQRKRDQAQYNPVAFAEQWLGEDEQNSLRDQLDNASRKTMHGLAQDSGVKFRKEFADEIAKFSADDWGRVSAKLAGKDDREAFIAFGPAITDVVAEKRAEAMHNQFRQQELAREREAIRQEVTAATLKGTRQPSLAQARGTTATDEPPLNSPEWDRWYERKYLRR